MNTTMRSIGRAAIAVIIFSSFTASAALINQWAFDGDFTDSVGSDNGSLDILNAITISGWVNVENSKSGGENQYLLDKQLLYSLRVRDDDTVDFMGKGSTRTTETITTNAWHHIATTYDKNTGGNNVSVYIDGNVSVQATKSGQFGTDNNPLRLGMYAASGGGPSTGWSFDGDMDEVRLSDVARSTNWMFATWLNMASNDVFQTYGEVGAEFVPPGTVYSLGDGIV